jgi:Holliday junction DNA helicase RuvA
VIGKVNGKLVERHPPQILIDVHGVGYEIDVPMSTFYELPVIGSDVALYTHFVVREDAHQLYGFLSEQERHMFRQLLKISGIGARTALAVLSGMSVSEIRAAIAAQDSARLTKIPGIGRKTAERLVLELKDKVDLTASGNSARSAASSDVLNALLALGYNDKEANWAVQQLQGTAQVTDAIKQALKLLSKS